MTLCIHKWAWETEIKKPSAKLVLLALADHASSTGHCHPSQKLIAKRTGLTDRSVRAMLKWLEDANLISRIERRREDGSRTSDAYQLPESAYRKILPGVRNDFPGVGKEIPGGAENSSGLELPIEPKKEKDSINTIPKKSASKPKIMPTPEIDLEFETIFWPQYPRSRDREPALKAFRAARKKTELSIIMAGVHRYAAERLGQPEKFTKHGKTWLNNKCWLNEAEQPEAPPDHGKVRTNSPEFLKQLAGLSNAADTNNEANLWSTIEEDAGQDAGSLGHGRTVGAAVHSVSFVN